MQEKIAQGVVIIDVRRQNEVDKYGIMPSAHKLTFFDNKDNYNAKKWLRSLSSLVKTKDTPFILVCVHANRTKIIGRFLDAKTDYRHIFELGGSINNGWISKGLSTAKALTKLKKPWWQF
ncbi:MAG: Rhodanese-like domain protein [Candidatus Ruthia sp. Apha_13_S6]|nr:Rhodanese-like domain protein [Candidatus Ruthia sp. Apha_13_S6]